MKQLTFFAGILLTGLLASAQTAPLGFLGAGPINRCAGMSPRVLNVTTLSAAMPGGCCGRRSDWVPGGTPYDLRLFAEQAIVDFNFGEFGYDGSFAKAINPYALAAEKLNVAGTKVSVCLKQYDIANIDQSMATGLTKTTVNLGYLVYATTGLGEKRRTVLVQELGGQIYVETGHFYFFSQKARLGHHLLRDTWPAIQSKTGDALKTVPNAEAEQGMAYMRGELSDFFSVEKSNEGVK